MEQTVRVRNVHPDGTAQVICLRQSACSGDCHKCAGCGAQQQAVTFDAVNAIGARAGDMVIVRSESGPVLLGAAVLYLMPLVLFFLGYLLGAVLLDSGGIAGIVAFALGIALAALYDRKVAKKQKTVYTIIGYAMNTRTKGDNDLD